MPKISTSLIFYSRMLLTTTFNEIRAKYSGTFLGIIWAILQPVLFLSLYSVVYIMIFKIKIGYLTKTDYVLLIFSGLIPFWGFSEALSAGIVSVQSNKSLIRNTFFPIELIPIRAVFSSSTTMLIGLLILQFVLWFRGVIHATQFLVPIILVMQIIFTIGFVLILSALQVFIRDLAQMISSFILFLMFSSPIAYTADMVPNSLMPLMYSNPLYYLIILYRGSMLVGSINIYYFFTFMGFAFIAIFLGYCIFSKLKNIFPDYL